MLTQLENELLTRTAPGSSMGKVLRRYWIPSLLSWELPEPDCAPIRLKLLGEDLVAFRDTNGKVGILDEFCPHRGASLWLGRNEECGLRCVYHGWKFDVDGACVDQMNERELFTDKIRATAYLTVEMGGVVWAYMGPRDRVPPFPMFEWTQAPATHRTVSKTWEECNWLQALEGGIDTSHAPILHRVFRSNSEHLGVPPTQASARNTKPTLEVELTDYGYRYFGIRPLGEEGTYVRGYQFVMPWTQIRPPDASGQDGVIPGHYWVPMDDENCMVWNWKYSLSAPLTQGELEEQRSGRGPSDQFEDFRKVANKQNDWNIDREAQRYYTFTGINGFTNQDHAIQESMGPIADRAREHLGPADAAVIATRKLLIDTIQTVEDSGDPVGIQPTYYSIRAADSIIPAQQDWHKPLMDEMHPARNAM